MLKTIKMTNLCITISYTRQFLISERKSNIFFKIAFFLKSYSKAYNSIIDAIALAMQMIPRLI